MVNPIKQFTMKSTKHLSTFALNRRFGGSFEYAFSEKLQKKYHQHEYHEFIIDEISDTIINYNFPQFLVDSNTKKPVQLYLFNLKTAIYNHRTHRFIQVREFILGDRRIKKEPVNWVENPHLSIYEQQQKVIIELLSSKECWIFAGLTVVR
jgi:hypothetical protein